MTGPASCSDTIPNSTTLISTRAPRARPVGFIKPCLPSAVKRAPARGGRWIQEIKYDGYRLLARKDAGGVRLLTRRGNDWTDRFPLVEQAVAGLPCYSCLVDGEVVACNEHDVPVFQLLRQRKSAHLCAFDLLEVNGEDLRMQPIEVRKIGLEQLVGHDGPGLMIGRVIDEPPEVAFAHVCALGLEGLVYKRRGSRYQSGRSHLWVKICNPSAPAFKRVAEGV